MVNNLLNPAQSQTQATQKYSAKADTRKGDVMSLGSQSNGANVARGGEKFKAALTKAAEKPQQQAVQTAQSNEPTVKSDNFKDEIKEAVETIKEDASTEVNNLVTDKPDNKPELLADDAALTDAFRQLLLALFIAPAADVAVNTDVAADDALASFVSSQGIGLADIPAVPADASPAQIMAQIDAAVDDFAAQLAKAATETAPAVIVAEAKPQIEQPAAQLPTDTAVSADVDVPQPIAAPQESNAQSDTDSDGADSNAKRETVKTEVKTETSQTATAVITRTEFTQNVAGTEMTQTQTETVPLNRMFDTLVEKASLVTEAGKSEITMSLKPEHLGKVSLQLSLTDEGLAVKITAENASVKGMLQNDLAQLVSSLQDKGVKVTAAEVTYGSLEQNAFSGNEQSQQQRQDGGTGGQRRNPVTLQPAYAAAYSTPSADAYTVYGEAEEVHEFVA